MYQREREDELEINRKLSIVLPCRRKKKATGEQNIKKANKQREISCYCRRHIHPVAPDRVYDATNARKEGKKGKGEEIPRQ